ncbi:hypothetical protein AAG906_024519 [Vitis piasezkii]
MDDAVVSMADLPSGICIFCILVIRDFEWFSCPFARKFRVLNSTIVEQVKVLTVCQSKNRNDLEDEVENSQENDERSYGSIMLERLTGSEDGRVDHMLQSFFHERLMKGLYYSDIDILHAFLYYISLMITRQGMLRISQEVSR